MSMVQDIIFAVVNAEQQVDEQISKLHSYEIEINQVIQRVESAFEGSERVYGNQMHKQLSITKKQVNQTIDNLQAAKDMLIQVRMI